MNRKLILCCALAALSFAGCKKLHSLFGKKPAGTTAAAATPVSLQKTVPAATPAPTPLTINKNAVAIALCYHNIDDKGSKALTISVEEFTREMQAIKDNGFTVIPLQDFLAWRRGEKTIPAKSAIITIDDGWVSAHDNAWPILKKFNYPFTLFIYIDYVNTGGKSMTWGQLSEMSDAGVDIESHTYTHSNLRVPGADVDAKAAAQVRKDIAALGLDGWLRKEIIDSKHVLEQKLGIKANVFAYPYGKYDSKVLAIVKEAGYDAAFTVYGEQLRYTTPPSDLLGRYAVEAGKPEIFENAMKMIGGGLSAPSEEQPDVEQLAATSMVTQPMDGETIGDAKPLIKANLATMGQLDPASVKMRISGVGKVPAKFDAASKTVTYQMSKLTEKSYTVIINAVTTEGKKIETQWTFNYDSTGKNVGPAPALPLPPRQ